MRTIAIAESRVRVLILLCRYVIANDLSFSAVEAMRHNIEINGLGETSSDTQKPEGSKRVAAKVRVNEGDAW